jgi:Holliday junction DNA helicase RuvB
LEFYSNEEIAKIVKRSAGLLKIDLDEDALKEIAKRSRFTPRTANYFLKRCRDFAQVSKKGLDQKTVKEALNMLAIDEIGLNSSDRKFLEILIEKFNGGPVGLKTIAAAMSEEEATVEEVIEPYLIQLGLLERSPRGRVATSKAYEHLGFDIKEEKQNKLI